MGRTIFTARGAILGLVLVNLAALIGGPTALVGMALGSLASTFNLAALAWTVRLACRTLGGGAAPREPTILVVLAFFVKLPVFLVAAVAANTVGGNALACFALGILLVYSWLAGWSLAQVRYRAK